MKHAATRSKHKAYPEPVYKRIGCKVSWYYYPTREAALDCSKAAKHNAVIEAGAGYDFGYSCPGDILGPIKSGPQAGLYEVTIP